MRLVDHLHLLFRVTIFEETVDVRQDVPVDGIRIDGGVFPPGLPFPLGRHLDHSLLARAGDALIGRNDDTPDGKGLMQRCQRQQHLDG